MHPPDEERPPEASGERSSNPPGRTDHHQGNRDADRAEGVLVYGTSPINRRRRRSTKADLADLDDAIITAVAQDAPVSLRGVFYRVVSMGAVEKTENGYRRVQRQLLQLRRDHRIRYSNITDGTRWVLRPTTYDDIEEALDDAADSYRRALWTRSDEIVHVFSEKDAITGVLHPVCDRWDVGLGITRGYSSETFAWNVANDLDRDRTNILVQFGDHDPSGVDAWREFGAKVTAFARQRGIRDVDVVVARLAVTEEQIEQYDLPTRPTKTTDTRSKGWVGGSVEVDAIPANELRRILDDFLAQFHDEHELRVLLTVQQEERETIRRLASWGQE